MAKIRVVIDWYRFLITIDWWQIGCTFHINALKVNGRTIFSPFSSTPRPQVSIFQRARRLFEVAVPIDSNR